jgi:hypothetical protein
MVTKKQKKKMEIRKKRSPGESNSMKNFWLGLVIVVVMISSVFAFGMMNNSSEGNIGLKYNDYKFLYANGMYILGINGNNPSFVYHPSEVERINISEGLKNTLRNTMQVDVTSDIEDPYKGEIAESQLYFQETLSKADDRFVRMGFTQPNIYNKTVITCNDATEVVPVFIYEFGEITEIKESGNCIYIRGNSAPDFLMLTTRLLYASLGIIE